MNPRTCADSMVSDEPDEQDERMLDMDLDEADPIASPENPLKNLLSSVEAETDVFKQVAALTDETLKAKIQGTAGVSEQDLQPQPEKTKRPPMPLTLIHILETAATALPKHTVKDDTDLACVSRVTVLYKPMQSFIQAVREEEGFVSKSLEEDMTSANQRNVLQRRLAKARQEFDLSNARRSRMQLWMGFTAKCVKASQRAGEK